jgi:hypothetical protein
LEQTKIWAETDTEWHAWTSFRSNRSGSAAARHREEDAATDALDVESTEFARCEVRIIDRGAMAGSAWIFYAASLDQMQLSPSGAKESFEIA